MGERFENVWDALVDDPVEAAMLKTRSTLMRAIAREVNSWGREQGYQTRAAAKLGTTRAQMCRLLSGKLDNFGLNVLFKIAIRAGLNPIVICNPITIQASFRP